MRHVRRILISCLAGISLALALPAASQTNVVYINGINNTLEDALATGDRIRDILSASENHLCNDKRSFRVTVIWNPVGWSGQNLIERSELTQDSKELFLLKTSEEHYASDYPKILAPDNRPGEIDQGAARRISRYAADLTPGQNSLERDAGAAFLDSAMSATRRAIEQLTARIEARKPVIVIAHSQGNLLVNLSYAMLAAKYGSEIGKDVRVVNVANTSRFSISNLNLTHAADAALFSGGDAKRTVDKSLETLPSQGRNWTRTTPTCPNDQACNFRLAPPTLGKPTSAITDQGLVDKYLDHSIVETYLSSATAVANLPAIQITNHEIRFRDLFEFAVYGAAASLEASRGAPNSPTAANPTMQDRLAGNATYRKAFESLFSGQTNLDSWLARYVREGYGVEGPATQCAIADQCFEYYFACEPHNCFNNHIQVFFEASGMAASALYINKDSGTSRLFGTPDHKLRSAMDVVESWEGRWPKPKCDFR